jgi:formylglycine-generating enzyme required for sulfatase activity
MRRLFYHGAKAGVLSLPLFALFFALSYLRTEAADGIPAGGKPVIEPLKQKGYAETIPDSKVSFDMVPVPGGTFLMGSPPTEKGRAPDEGPQHWVKINPFWMGKTEVTWDEFDLFFKPMEEGEKKDQSPQQKEADAITRPTPAYVDETYGHGREGHPVLCMTHHAAMEYCRWLSLKTGKHYRLPTEAEWEYACLAGSTTPYFFGSDPKSLDEYAWYAKNADDLTHEVGKKKPNPWGLYDMYGNVGEWCLDHYKKDYYATFPPNQVTLEPVLLPTERRFSHVVRGGSWSDEPDRLRSAARLGSERSWMKHDPQRPQSIWWLTKWDVVGLRVVRAVEEQDNLKHLRSKVTKESD